MREVKLDDRDIHVDSCHDETEQIIIDEVWGEG